MSVIIPDSPTDKQSFGQAGACLLTGTEYTLRDVCAILFLEDSVLSSVYTVWPEFDEGVDKNLIGNTLTITVPNGITIVGQFTSVGLDSGAILCYYAA
jgi:hypothetical protein